MLEEGEFVILYRDRKKKGDWNVITNNFTSKRNYSDEERKQHRICQNIIDNAYQKAITEHGISTDVFYDELVVQLRLGKVIASVDDNNNIVSFDEFEDSDESREE